MTTTIVITPHHRCEVVRRDMALLNSSGEEGQIIDAFVLEQSDAPFSTVVSGRETLSISEIEENETSLAVEMRNSEGGKAYLKAAYVERSLRAANEAEKKNMADYGSKAADDGKLAPDDGVAKDSGTVLEQQYT